MTRTALWPLHPLGDLVDVMDGRRVPVNAKERARRPGQVPYYGAAGQVGWIDQPLFDQDLLLLGEDGVLFFDPAKSKAYRISGPSWVNNHAHVLRARSGVDWRYLEHYLNWFDYRGYANGTTRLKLTQAAMKRIPVPLPEPAEQRRIVDILDDHLSHLDAANDCLDRASLRLGGLVDAALSHNFALSAQQLAPLASVLDAPLSNGRSVPTREGGFPVLRLTALRGDRVDLGERKSGAWTEEDARRFLVAGGDVLVSRGNGSLKLVGRASCVAKDPDSVAFPDTMVRIRPDANRLDPGFLTLVWNSRPVRRQIESIARTTAGIYKISQKDLAGILLPLPPLPVQKEACQRLFTLRANRLALDSTLMAARKRSAALRQSLLMAAFSGRLTGRASDLDLAEEMTLA